MSVFSEQSDINEYYAGQIINDLRENYTASSQTMCVLSVMTSLSVHVVEALREELKDERFS